MDSNGGRTSRDADEVQRVRKRLRTELESDPASAANQRRTPSNSTYQRSGFTGRGAGLGREFVMSLTPAGTAQSTSRGNLSAGATSTAARKPAYNFKWPQRQILPASGDIYDRNPNWLRDQSVLLAQDRTLRGFLSKDGAVEYAERNNTTFEAGHYGPWDAAGREQFIAVYPLVDRKEIITTSWVPQNSLRYEEEVLPVERSTASGTRSQERNQSGDNDAKGNDNQEGKGNRNENNEEEMGKEGDAGKENQVSAFLEMLEWEKSTRIPDFCQLTRVKPIGNVDLVKLAGRSGYNINKFREMWASAETQQDKRLSFEVVTLLFKIKPGFKFGPHTTGEDPVTPHVKNRTLLMAAATQVREQATHFFKNFPEAEAIGAVIGFGRFYTYREYYREQTLGRQLTLSKDDQDYQLPEDIREEERVRTMTEREFAQRSELGLALNRRFGDGKIFLDMHSGTGEKHLRMINQRVRQLFPHLYQNRRPTGP
ncbi:hypothetical protein BD626DRAFT_572512 [Schizophyllum amplum]|uniref:Uncharacterized protein n=1 Tax=Schizophyllum amplum TaxID=97359 RepID=A0A550C429_9AGAR|nr:hypothetical protein BD626DRAFT_572512 [Auriculariopsis ampla]